MPKPLNLIFMLGLAAGCGLAQSQAAGQPPTYRQPPIISTEAWHAVPDARGVQLVNVECGDHGLDPHEIVVKSHLPVELLVRTSLPSLEFVSGFVPSQAIARQPTAHRFTPTAAGRFPLLCQTRGVPADPGGARISKKGLLTVVPGAGTPQ